jgi:4-hydroxybenzoyl-CoA thioesterase
MAAFTNSRTVRIEWGDCDPAGIIYYPRYFEIFDASTAAVFERALGITKFQMFKTLEFAGRWRARRRAF